MVIYRPILKELALRGHHIVAILPDPINDPNLQNLIEINVHNVSYETWSEENRLAETRIEKESSFQSFANLYKVLLKICDQELSHSDVKQLINNKNEHFDLVINEWLMYASTFAFGEYFNCPMIGISSMPLFITGYDTIGVPTHPAYALDFWKLSGTDLTFWERLDNMLHSIWFRLYYHLVVLPDHDRVAKKHFGTDLKYIGDIERDVALVLINTNPVFHVSRPLPTTAIEIGGIHLKQRKQLPEDLKRYLDESDQGVIYMSLGSNVQSISLPKEKLQIFFSVFSHLPYNILWKWESDDISKSYQNIRTNKWLPQQDVLDHKNVKLFITQGGLQSIEESIRSGVPMLGIPFAGDQDHNVARIASLKIGHRLYLEDLTEKLLNETIFELIENSRYKEEILEISNVLWDQETQPLERAIWWIEYVIRHKGTKRLRSALVDIPWYKYLLLDVISFLLICLFFILLIIRSILKFIVSAIRKISKKQKRIVRGKNKKE